MTNLPGDLSGVDYPPIEATMGDTPTVTPQANRSPSAAPAAKVLASAGGNGLGGVIGVIAVWGLGKTGLEIPLEVAMSIATLCGIVAGFIAGYITPPRSI